MLSVADVTTGVLIVIDGHWEVWGGTSVASPIVAAAIALAGNARSLHGAKEIWKSNGAHFFDITKGDDLVPAGGTGGTFPLTCLPAYPYLCTAGKGYDGPTGWGTPNGVEGL